MGSLLPLLALLGAAGGAGSLEERGSCGGIIDVISAANGTIHLPAAKGPLAPTGTCTWVVAALPSEEVRVEIKALEAAAHPNLSVRFEGSPGEGAGREVPVDIAHSFLLKGQGRTVIRGSLDSSLTFTYWVAVDWCARLALCCSVVGSAQTCLCPGNSTGQRCRTGVNALEALREGVGQVASQEAPVKLRGAVGARGRAQSVFVVEDQPPLLKATRLRMPCELALDMEFVGAFRTPGSQAHRSLVQSFNETVAPLFTAVPGFQSLEVTRIRKGSVVLEYDALFAAERLRGPVQGLGALLNRTVLSGAARSGLRIASAIVLWNVVLERQLDLCTALFSCHAGFECISRGAGNASCTSVCHRDYCKNHGICTHPRAHEPVCQCPIGNDYWFMGPRCDYKVTQQSLLGVACGVLLTVALLGLAIACLVVRRFKALLLEARVDQTKSSYRRFCRLDDVSAQYWSQSWLTSANSLDNPAFSNSEELLHLQMLDHSCCSCKDDTMIPDSYKQQTTPISTVCRPSFPCDWDTSSSSINDPMIDSGKASDISVSSWPMEPVQWTPFPILHHLSRQRPPKASRRPHSYCEGMELVDLERSWTA
ncbi:unnamed protein product [Caretta caretta]